MKATASRDWLWAAIVFAATYFVLRIALRGPTDGANGKSFMIAFLSSVPAIVASATLTLASVKCREDRSGVAIASGVVYFGVCVAVLLF